MSRNKRVNKKMIGAVLEDWVNYMPAKDITIKYGISEPTIGHWVVKHWLYCRADEVDVITIQSRV